MYHTSVRVLKQILSHSPGKNKNNNNTVSSRKDNLSSSSSSSLCSIVKVPSRILYLGNGEEYYHVELSCNDGIEYGIQAYGDEAKALYREANRFDISSNDLTKGEKKLVWREEVKEEEDKGKKEEQEEKKFMLVRKEVDYITNFTFDSKNGYPLLFKKLKDVCISKKRRY